ncbi:MAG: hypothetical protein QM630_08510 [Microbacterium sp.]
MGAKHRFLAYLLLVGTVALASCGTPQAARTEIPHDATEGGQTKAEMRAHIESIPGIRVTNIVGGGPPNIKGNTGYWISLELSEGYEIQDGPGLVTFVAESIWSIREGYMPNTEIDIDLRMPEGQVFNMTAAAVDGGWVAEEPGVTDEYSIASITVQESDEQGMANLERLGTWPGAVPEAPADITAAVSPGR